MERGNKLEYFKKYGLGPELDAVHTNKYTLNEGLNEGGCLCFNIQADPERFTDLNSIYLRVELDIKRGNGNDIKVDGSEQMSLDMAGIHSLFKTCDVIMDDQVISSMSLYPYSTQIIRYMGQTKDQRESIDTVDGTWLCNSTMNHVTTGDGGNDDNVVVLW